MLTEKEIREAKNYLKLKVLQGMFDEDLFSVLDEKELYFLAKHTKEREELWKNL